MKKLIIIGCIAIAAIVESIAAVVIFGRREAIARAEAAKAASLEEVAQADAKRAKSEEEAAKSQVEAERLKVEAAKLAREQAAEDSRKLQLENENLAEKKALAAEERQAADAEAKIAADQRAVKDLEFKTAKELADAERAKAAAAADELASAEARKAIEEAETLKLRVSLSELEAEKDRYRELAAELADIRRDLEERERALLPEKTSADLVWLGLDANGKETNGVAAVRKALPENDPNNPAGVRLLARAERLRDESSQAARDAQRAAIIAALEAQILRAKDEDRITDMRYYRAMLKSLYPDWKSTPGTPAEKEVK